jgi:hypothetical protein
MAERAIQSSPVSFSLSFAVKEVRVGIERQRRSRVPHLTSHIDGIVPLADENARERVAQRMEGDVYEPSLLRRLVEPPLSEVARLHSRPGL